MYLPIWKKPENKFIGFSTEVEIHHGRRFIVTTAKWLDKKNKEQRMAARVIHLDKQRMKVYECRDDLKLGDKKVVRVYFTGEDQYELFVAMNCIKYTRLVFDEIPVEVEKAVNKVGINKLKTVNIYLMFESGQVYQFKQK